MNQPNPRPDAALMDLLAVPEHRHEPLHQVLRILEDARHVALTTHVNADGDGAGSEAALAGWLLGRGKKVAIVNPTPFPDRFHYLLPAGVEVLDPGQALDARVREADVVAVVDTGEPGRIGRVAKGLKDDATVVIDHHPVSDDSIPGPGLRDPSACATGELVYDLITLAAPAGDWPEAVIQGLYAAIETDTGSFRFSNTTPRTHVLAADLLRRGVDPEAVYRRLHATVPLRRVEILRLALDNLEVDADLPIAWITIPRQATHEMEATADDLDGVTEYARSIEGTEVALLFRETLDGATKVSFRSNGEVDVNAIARRFGGGGHVKAAGALVGGPIEANRPRVLDATREAVRALLHDPAP